MPSLRAVISPLGERGRSARVLAVSILAGVVIALAVAGFEVLTVDGFLEPLLDQPLWLVASAPVVGLLAAAALLRWGAGGATPSTSDEYIRAFHERTPRMPFRQMPAKLLAGALTIGSGGALGLEGPSIYAGATTGLALHGRLGRLLRREDAHLLLTAGAAAGVAAVFKAPATGVLFALESPYRGDLARRALLPALIASAASYVTYVTIVGSDPVISFIRFERLLAGEDVSVISRSDIEAVVSVELGDLLGALLLGVAAGLGGRAMAAVVRSAKSVSQSTALWRRVASAGVLLALLAVLSDVAFDEPLTIGPGFDAVDWATEPDRGLGLIALLFGMRLVATLATLAGGGVGGMFIPLVTQGAILGQFVGELVGSDRPFLYPTLGLAAFLGAGYRTPIAAVMFVAEVSPSGSFVVPALVASAVSQLVAGRASVAAHQRAERLGHLERRFELPITAAIRTDVLTVPPDPTVSEFVFVHVLGHREAIVPVVDGNRYLGMVSLDDLSDLDRERWDETPVLEVARRDAPAAAPSWTLRDAVASMDSLEVSRLAVCDQDGGFVGIVDEADIVKLDEILDQTGG